MGRDSGFDNKEGMKKGVWTACEDQILKDYIKMHGEGKWNKIARATGLKRCGKSLRLRWFNYLRPDIKRGNIAEDEEDIIIRMHKLVGNRWSLIAGRIPGRTDNEIKNYWKSTLKKKVTQKSHLEVSRNEMNENLLLSPKVVAVEDDDQHLIENNGVGGGGGMITPVSKQCFADNVNVDEENQRRRHHGNTSTKSSTFSSKVGVSIEAKNDVELAAYNLNDDAKWTDLIIDMNEGQFGVTKFFRTDFSKVYESEGTFNFEVGGCGTNEDWLNNM